MSGQAVNMFGALSLEETQLEILAALGAKLEAGEDVGLDADTVAALRAGLATAAAQATQNDLLTQLVTSAATAATTAAVEALGAFLRSEANSLDTRHVLPYSKDASDRIRSLNEGGNIQANQYLFNTATQGSTYNLGGYATWWSRDVATMDQREVEREQSRQTFISTRARWSIT